MRLAVTILMLALLPLGSYAQEAPTPPTPAPARSLLDTESALEDKRRDLNILEKKISSLDAELTSLRKNLTGMAKRVKENEAALTTLETTIKTTSQEQEAINARLEKDKASIAAIILGMERLRRVPPEVVMLRPGAPLETAQSAMVLNSILPQIYGRAAQLSSDIERLKTLRAQQEENKQALLKTQETLQAEYISMEKGVKERETLFSKTNVTHRGRAQEVQVIAAKAASLKDLVQKLEEDKRREKEREIQAAAALPAPDEGVAPAPTLYKQPESLPKAGLGQLPASGLILTGYGETDAIGAKAQGITLQTRKGALVVAPMGGKIEYAGYFKNYGQIIIMEHEKGYHSLIAGMSRIDIVVEQSVGAGEPLGLMPSEGADQPELYYELRHKGRPVNPAAKILNLKS